MIQPWKQLKTNPLPKNQNSPDIPGIHLSFQCEEKKRQSKVPFCMTTVKLQTYYEISRSQEMKTVERSSPTPPNEHWGVRIQMAILQNDAYCGGVYEFVLFLCWFIKAINIV